MNSTTTQTSKIKILLDLKPAFDGYAGIPQETRLLFRGLRTIASCEVEGLIQHGGLHLRSAIPQKNNKYSNATKINKLSQLVVSVYQGNSGNGAERIIQKINNYLRHKWVHFLLRLKLWTGVPVRTSIFESSLFEDFVWRTFFSKTLNLDDKNNVTSARFHILKMPRKMLHQVGLAGLRYTQTPKYNAHATAGFDVFLAQTPYPGRVTAGTQMVIRYHDAVPILLPHTINDKVFHQSSHFYALQDNVRSGAWFACVSKSTQNDLLRIFPEVESRSVVIHNIVSNEYYDDQSQKQLTFQIIRNRVAKTNHFDSNLKSLSVSARLVDHDFQYLLMVSTLEPRKNHALLLSAWERLKYTSMPNLKLVIVGGYGWDSDAILQSFKPWAESGDLFFLNNVPSSELRTLYKHAAVTVCPSLAEGFDYTGVEAMRCDGLVVASDIPVHREIYGNASEYFNAYSADDAAAVLRKVLTKENVKVREDLRAAGREVSAKYTSKNILPKWDSFLSSIRKP
ncbi:MAG: glycosyltransferase family 1 protein [Arenimonas sp.]